MRVERREAKGAGDKVENGERVCGERGREKAREMDRRRTEWAERSREKKDRRQVVNEEKGGEE